MLYNLTVHVDLLKPFYTPVDASPGPVSDVGQGGGHEVELLLNCRTRLGRGVYGRYLVLWRSHTSADDEWQGAEELLHCSMAEKGG
jgi:hypothetical protein